MAKIGNGKRHVKQEITKALTADIKTSSGPIDFAALYDKVDAEKVERVRHASVSAEQIREVIDGTFEGGKTEVAVATVCDMVNIVYDLAKEHHVQNSSVRSAGTAGKKYKIVTINTNAYFIKA
jgi:hypothetical protein